jgi:Predicted dehydrogenases and related proteins
MKQSKYSRKEFVKGMAIAAAGFMIVPRHVLGGRGFLAPSDKITVGIVGAGGKGRQNAEELLKLKDVQITAVADPAKYWDLKDFYYKSKAGREPVKEMIESHYKSTNGNYRINEYIDFREMLEKESSLDAIMCSTPDNTHAYVSIKALRAGKHVYCEKPLTHNVWEARKVREVALETGLATQMGNVLHSGEGIRQTVEYLRDGAIGKVEEAHTWVPASRWNPGLKGLPAGPAIDEQSIGWDLWLGPTPYMPCHKEYVPVTWRDFWALGCGALGDFGCHDLDASVWAFDLHAPESVEVLPAGYSDANIAPYGEIGYYHFAKNGNQPEFKQVWYSGGLQPPRPELLPDNVELPSRGSLFIGKKGIIVTGAGGSNPQIFPERRRERYNPPKPSIPRSNGHFRDWVDAIKGGPAASSNFEYGARLTEITLLGVLSLRLGGKKIYWDSENMRAKGLPEADPFLREPVRSGWEMA